MEIKPFYHGSKKCFERFDACFSYGSKRRFVLGAFWFSNNIKVAKSYGKTIYEVFLDIKKPFKVDASFENYSEIYLSSLPKEICNIIDYLDRRCVGDTFNEMEYRRKTEPDFSFRFDSRDLAFSAMKTGYDSIIIDNVIDAGNKSALKIFGTTVAVFSPDQIFVNNVILPSNAKKN